MSKKKETIWYVQHPLSLHEGDVKKDAREKGLTIVDHKFYDGKSETDVPPLVVKAKAKVAVAKVAK